MQLAEDVSEPFLWIHSYDVAAFYECVKDCVVYGSAIALAEKIVHASHNCRSLPAFYKIVVDIIATVQSIASQPGPKVIIAVLNFYRTAIYFNIASQQVLSHIIHYPWYVYSILSIITGIVIPVCAYKYLKKHRESRWCKITAILLGQHFR